MTLPAAHFFTFKELNLKEVMFSKKQCPGQAFSQRIKFRLQINIWEETAFTPRGLQLMQDRLVPYIFLSRFCVGFVLFTSNLFPTCRIEVMQHVPRFHAISVCIVWQFHFLSHVPLDTFRTHVPIK